MIVLASGPEGTRAQLEPIFDAIGRKTLWLGPAGNGTRLKLVLNDWLAPDRGSGPTIALTEALGLDPQLFIDAIDDGPLGSPYAVAKARAALGGELAPGFALRLAFKDVGLALDAAEANWSCRSPKRYRDAGSRRLPTAMPTRTSPPSLPARSRAAV